MNGVYFIIQQTIFFFIPLMIVSLGGLYSERSGVSNIALEGIMILGAFVGTLTINFLEGVVPGQWAYIIAILTAAVSGLLYSMLHAWASIRLKADQTISGTALNLFAPAFCIFMARNIYGTQQVDFEDAFRIESIPVLGDIPVIGKCFFTNCYISTFIGIAVLIILAVLLNRTPFGLRLKACGENPDSAAGVGINVVDMRYKGVAMSGLLAGAGGIIFIVPTSTNFAATVSGYGFLALAVLILGQWKPAGILAASVFFGILKAISSAYSGIPFLAQLNIPSEVYKMIPYVLTLVVLTISSQKSLAPKAVGKPYDDGTGVLKNFKNNKKSRILAWGVLAAFIIISLVMSYRSSARNSSRGVSHGYGAQVALVLGAAENVDDKSFIQSEWDGILEYSNKYGVTKKYYQAQDKSDKAQEDVFDLAAKGNAEVIIVSSQLFEKATYEKQKTITDIPILLIDGIPTSKTGEKEIKDNVLCLGFAEQQAGFLAGYAAVMEGYRNLGFAGGMAVPAVTKYGYGFINGADYAAKELGLKRGDVEIMFTYAGTFTATPEVLAMASSWYLNGTEVIFACGGGMNNAIMKAAESYKGKVIGVDNDQSKESPTVITSAIKKVGYGICTVLEKMRSGEITKGGESKQLTAADGAVGLSMETSRFRQFSQEQYDRIYSMLANGEIKNIPDDTTYKNLSDFQTGIVEIKEIR